MLTQSEADALIAMEKRLVRRVTISMPPGVDTTHQLVGSDERERFLLDLRRGAIRVSKVNLQTRGRNVVVLVRLDVDGAPHTNPDGQRISGTHLHVYREEFEDKWAFPLNPAEFADTTDLARAFRDFCRYSNVVDAPPFQEGLL